MPICKRLGETHEEWVARKRAAMNLYRRTAKNQEYRRAYAQRHEVREGRRRIAHKYRVKATAEKRAYLIKFKSETPCVDCGNKFPWYVMDLDHVRGEKYKDVSKMVGSGDRMKSFIEEIAKCDCVCANCHRVRTFTRADHLKSLSLGAPAISPAMDAGSDAGGE